MGSQFTIDWSRRFRQVISRYTNIPTDITFQIVDGGKVEELKAHKMILGMVSPVFLNMFFVVDTDDRTANTIMIEQTSAPAFQIMLDAIYFVTSIEDSLRGKTVDEVFAVLDVVTRYQIPELVNEVEGYIASLHLSVATVMGVVADAVVYLPTFHGTARSLILHCVKFMPSVDMVMTALDLVSNYENPGLIAEILEILASLPLSSDNVMKVACKAVNFQTAFEEKVQDLLFNCAKYLMSRFTDLKSVFRFTAENEDEMATVCKLQALMIDIPEKCQNCQEKNCRNGLDVYPYRYRKGLIVMNKDTKLITKVVDFKSQTSFFKHVVLKINGENETFWEDNFPKLIFRCVRSFLS